MKMSSNYFEKFDQSVVDFMPFHGKLYIMDHVNWGAKSDWLTANLVLY